MEPSSPHSQLTSQLNLPLLQGRTCVLPDDKETELVQALVELLISAASSGAARGGDDESETHR